MIQIQILIDKQWLTNSADPVQLASSEANWSGSALFVKAGYIWVQQDYRVKIHENNVQDHHQEKCCFA